MGIHGVAQYYELRLFLALSNSIPDSSTARYPISVVLMGYYSMGSQLHNSVRYVPMQWIFVELTPWVLLDLIPDSSTTRYLIPILSSGHCLLRSQLYNSIMYVPTR